MSSSTVRPSDCTGGSKRSTSPTALRASDGSSRRRANWSGWRAKARTPLAIRLTLDAPPNVALCDVSYQRGTTLDRYVLACAPNAEHVERRTWDARQKQTPIILFCRPDRGFSA